MKILIDIGHPAHVHYYKNFIHEMQKRGHAFLVTARDRECIHELLRHEKIEFVNRGTGAGSLAGKVIYTLKADSVIGWRSLRFAPDLFLSHGSHYTAHVAKLLRKPCICTGDSDHIKVNARILIPYINTLLTPRCYRLNYGDKHIFYDGYSELFYLHPAWFTPDETAPQRTGIGPDEKYFVVRFVSWNAFHDVGQQGFSLNLKLQIIQILSRFGRVIISSESRLPEAVRPYQTDFSAHDLHHLIAGASLFIGEGATTASEAALLGTPSIYINPLEVSYCAEQEQRYQLCYNFRDEKGVMAKLEQLLQTENLKGQHLARRRRMLAEKINPTEFLVWFIENYPESHDLLRCEPDYQYRFK